MSFRTSNDRLKITNLFIDTRYDEGAIYCLADKDKEVKGKHYPSLYRLYIEMSDITEYNFANKYLESYQHWLTLCEEEWFKPIVTRWRKEIELKVKSQALLEIVAQATSEDPRKRLEAAKYLYEKVGSQNSNGRGRPSKAEIKAETEKLAREAKILDEHSRLLAN